MATKEDFQRIGNYARMYNADQNIDRRQKRRIVPMDVLALGYSRTGTLSMRRAFEILGYPNPYHFSSFYDNVQDCDIWNELIDSKYSGRANVTKDKFDGLLGHCGAVTDMPCHLFAAELIAYYPEAKIVLVERDIDSWFKSWSGFLDNAFDPMLPLIAKLDPYWMGRIVSVGVNGVNKQVGGATTLANAKARSKEEYRKHYALVRSSAARERILEYRLGQGWEPLCRFLGKPVPQEPFPHLNDSESNSQSFKELAMKGIKRILWNFFLVLAAVGVVVLAFIYGS